MSTLSTLSGHKGTWVASVKGAPETLQHMYTSVPSFYESTYKYFTRRGSRVLALGYKMMEHKGDVSVTRSSSNVLLYQPGCALFSR